MTIFRKSLILGTLMMTAAAGPALAVTFTGNVSTDFAVMGVQALTDPADVGLPLNAPPLTVSGWDFEALAFVLDPVADMLYVGIDFNGGIAGDADGDGGDGSTSGWLAQNGGTDIAGLGQTESICMAFDFDQNGTFDLVAGVDGNGSTHWVAMFAGSPLLPQFAFGAAMPMYDGGSFYTPAAGSPDYEFALSNFSMLDAVAGDEVCFTVRAFAGSFQDDGIGEDYRTGEICIPITTTDAAPLVADFELKGNYPNPFNPTTSIRFTLPETEFATLTVYNMAGQAVTTLVNGVLETGTHEVTFDGSQLSSGLYFYSLQAGAHTATGKMLLAK